MQQGACCEPAVRSSRCGRRGGVALLALVIGGAVATMVADRRRTATASRCGSPAARRQAGSVSLPRQLHVDLVAGEDPHLSVGGRRGCGRRGRVLASHRKAHPLRCDRLPKPSVQTSGKRTQHYPALLRGARSHSGLICRALGGFRWRSLTVARNVADSFAARRLFWRRLHPDF